MSSGDDVPAPIIKDADISKEDFHHDEDQPGLSEGDEGEVILSYGDGGLRGLARSPYVLGAAALASMGGFAFGYGDNLKPKS